MKKLAILFILLCALTACAEVNDHSKPKKINKTVLLTEPLLFEFNGHEYIRFHFSTHAVSVVHNPDCKCFKKDSTIVID